MSNIDIAKNKVSQLNDLSFGPKFYLEMNGLDEAGVGIVITEFMQNKNLEEKIQIVYMFEADEFDIYVLSHNEFNPSIDPQFSVSSVNEVLSILMLYVELEKANRLFD